MILFFLIVFLASMENLYAEIFFIGYNNERMESFVRRWTESHIKSDCKKKKKKKKLVGVFLTELQDILKNDKLFYSKKRVCSKYEFIFLTLFTHSYYSF